MNLLNCLRRPTAPPSPSAGSAPAGLRWTIHVTREDIASGVLNSCSRCPVARAIRRCAEPVPCEARVLLGTIRITSGGRHYVAPTPPAVAEFIAAFDEGDPWAHGSSGFTFTLEAREVAG